MAANPVGYVVVANGGDPGAITMFAREDITAGQFVFASGTADVISSGANSFAASDLLCAATPSGNTFTGVAMATVASGAALSVATRGKIIVRAGGTVTAGRIVGTGGGDSVLTVATAGNQVGRSLTSATSGGYAIIDFK